MKTPREIIADGELKFYIEEGALPDDATIEDVKTEVDRIIAYFREILEQKRQEYRKNGKTLAVADLAFQELLEEIK